MADTSKLTINTSRDKSPELFNQADHSPGQESKSPTEKDIVQPETSKINIATKESKKALDDTNKANIDHVGESELTIVDEFEVFNYLTDTRATSRLS